MKSYQFLIFFGIVLSIYTLLHLYIFSRGLQAFPAGSTGRSWFTWTFWLLAVAYPLARFLERIWLSPVSDVLTWIGSFWLAAFLYFLLAVIIIDVARLLNLVIPFFKLLAGDQPAQARWLIFVVTAGTVVLLVIAGHINALTTKISHHSITINKPSASKKTIRVVAISDIHMGTVIGPRRLSRLIGLIADQKPDIVLMAGDVVDEDLAPVIRYDLGKLLKEIKAPLGVYAITGNHEYIGGAEKAVKYLTDHGISMLRDTALLIDHSFYLIGREDRDRSRFSGKPRKSVGELVKGLDPAKPKIMLDHQPYALHEVVDAGIDLQISGHTHHGQLWPLGYVTSAIFELSRGYRQKANTHFLVSTGFGTWGPPVRTGNRPEILVIDLTFEQ